MVLCSAVHKASAILLHSSTHTGRHSGEPTFGPPKHYRATGDACDLRASCSHGAMVTRFGATSIEVWCMFLLAHRGWRSYMIRWLIVFCTKKASTRSPHSFQCMKMSRLVKIRLQWRGKFVHKSEWCQCLKERWTERIIHVNLGNE